MHIVEIIAVGCPMPPTLLVSAANFFAIIKYVFFFLKATSMCRLPHRYIAIGICCQGFFLVKTFFFAPMGGGGDFCGKQKNKSGYVRNRAVTITSIVEKKTE